MSKKKSKPKILLADVVDKLETDDIEHALLMAQTEVSERIEELREELEELENKFECYEEALVQLGIISDLRSEE